MTTLLSKRGLGVVGLALAAALAGTFLASTGRAQEGRMVPAPSVDLPAGFGQQVAILAGGCFWGVQGVFQHVAGVTSAVSGYAGGDKRTAQYDAVSAGGTGHAEVVRVTYDPRRISYGRILQIYFGVAHDPTQLNRQGPDRGTQYRSAIFPTSGEQARIARSYIAQLDQARAYSSPIVTRIEPSHAFHPAEGYHQDYLTRHPTNAYIVANDLPKIQDLRRLFPDVYTPNPRLVSARAE